MSAQPLVTVVIPLYNYEKYIASAIESVLAQTYPELELIVVDDGSTDGGPAIVEGFQDQRLRLIRQRRNGCGVARAVSRGIAEARGEYISWLSADDYYLPEKIARNVQAMNEGRQHDPRLAMIHSQPGIESADREYLASHCPLPPEEIDRQMREQGRVRWAFPAVPAADRDMLLHLLMWNQINGCTTLIRKDVFAEIGAFRDSWSVAQDYEMWLRMLLAGYSVKYLPDILTIVRFHEVNKGLYQDIVPAEANLVGRFGVELADPDRMQSSLMHLGIPADQFRQWRAELFAKQHIFDYALAFYESCLAQQLPLSAQAQAQLPGLRQLLQLPAVTTEVPAVKGRSYLICLSEQGIRPWRLQAVLTHFFIAFGPVDNVELLLWCDPEAQSDLQGLCETKIDGIVTYLARSRASLPAYRYLLAQELAAAVAVCEVLIPIGNPDMLEQRVIYAFKSAAKTIQYQADSEDFRRARDYDSGRQRWRLPQRYLWMWPDAAMPLESQFDQGQPLYYRNHWFEFSETETSARIQIWAPGQPAPQTIVWDRLNIHQPGLCQPAWSTSLLEEPKPLQLEETAKFRVLVEYADAHETGWRQAIEAFARFPAEVALLLHVDPERHDLDSVLDTLGQAIEATGQNPDSIENLVLLGETFDLGQWTDLLASVDAWIGFGSHARSARWPGLLRSRARWIGPAISDALTAEWDLLLEQPADLVQALPAWLESLMASGLDRPHRVLPAAYLHRQSRADWLKNLLNRALEHALTQT